MKPVKLIDNPSQIDKGLIKEELNNGKRVVFQFSEKIYTNKILSEINKICGESDFNFTVRFYGHYFDTFDCKTLEKIPLVKSLALDYLKEVENIECLAELEHLESLSIYIFELKETELLRSDNFKKLKELVIVETKTKAFNLEYLKDYKNLSSLIVGGHTKNIAAIGELKNLEFLSLNSIGKVSIDFVNKLKKLKTLKFILGGRENLDELKNNEIESLEIIRVRGFSSFSNISNFGKLKNLLIEDQIRLTELNLNKSLDRLETVKLLNCKNFTNFENINNLPALKELRIYKTNINFDSFITQKMPKSLKVFTFCLGKVKPDREYKEILLSKGYKAQWK